MTSSGFEPCELEGMKLGWSAISKRLSSAISSRTGLSFVTNQVELKLKRFNS